MNTDAPLLEVNSLHAGYGSVEVLHGVDLLIRPGELSVIIGPNGHGKTTLLRTLSGLVTPTSGNVRFAGDEITGHRPERIVARGLVHIAQGDLLFPDMTVLENLYLGAFLPAAHRRRKERLDQVYAIFPRLAERGSQRARTLSGGERRMLALGRGLMSDARLMMIDEPSLGLAPVLVDEVYRQIRAVSATGITILLVEENVGRVRDVADHLTLIENGVVLREGKVDEVLADPAIAASYLGIDT